jgi:hypothetical protein
MKSWKELKPIAPLPVPDTLELRAAIETMEALRDEFEVTAEPDFAELFKRQVWH